ncbi:MAG TPA: GAF domain-containing protein, partial [Pyrinomonadaceae bacterium]|nr:GAF domain-containing protein [Pyrinomonadaceae bacterium]
MAKIARQADQNGAAYVNEFSETPDILIDNFNLRDTRSIRVITLHTKRGQKPMAILFLGFSQELRDEVQEDESLTTLLQHSSLVLENLWLLGRYRAVIKIGQKLNRKLNTYRDLFDKLREEVASIIDTSYFFMLAVHQPQSDTLDRYFSIEEGNPVVQLNIQLDGASEVVIKKGQSLKTFNLGQDKSWKVDHVDLLGKAKPDSKSVIFEPLIFRGVVLGLITVQNPEPNAYDEEDVRIMKLLGNQVALALSNLRLFMYLETLNDVGQRLTENLTSEDLLENVAEEVRKATHADIITLYPYLPAENRFAQPVYAGDLRNTEFLQPTILADNIAWLTLKLGKPVWAKDSSKLYAHLGGDPKKREGNFEEREEIASTAALGLRIGDEDVGVMFANFRVRQRFPASQQQLILGLAHYAAIAIKNYRKYTALNQRRYDDLVALQKIDRQMRLTPRLKQIMRPILKGAVSRIPAADESAILLYNQRTGELETAASVGKNRRAYKNLALPVQNGSGISVWVYQNKLPVRVDYVKTDPQWRDIYYSVFSDTLSEMDVPLIDEDQVVGVISFESKREKAFTQEDQDFSVTLAGQAVLAIKNAQLYEQAEFARKELETLQDVAQEITIQEGDPETVMQLILKKARVLLGAEMGALQLYDGIRPGKVYLSEANTPSGEPIINTLEPRDNEQLVKLGIVQRVAVTREPHITKDDAVNDPYYEGSPNFHSEITVPLISRSDELIGVLDLESPRLYAFSDDDLKVLEAFARQAVIAIQYAQVYSRALSESERFRLLAEAGSDLGELTDIKQLPEAYRIILRKVSEFNNGEILIRRFDEPTQELVLEDVLNPQPLHPPKSIPIDKGINGQVARERKTIVVPDLRDPPKGIAEPVYDDASVRTLAVTPIQFQKTRYYGNLVLSHGRAHSLGPSDVSLLQGLAQQLAITIHRLEMVQARMEAEQQAKDLELV